MDHSFKLHCHLSILLHYQELLYGNVLVRAARPPYYRQ